MGALRYSADVGFFLEGEDAGLGGKGRDVFWCALMRALAGAACLPCTLHLTEVT